MTKKTTIEASDDIWQDTPPELAARPQAPVAKTQSADFDMEGLMTDFPTARDLERFVYDETGVVLNLKGRANKLKYQIAMQVLNGETVDDKFLGGENPYVEKAELIPTEDLAPVPERDRELPPLDQIQNSFVSRHIPHPDPEMRAVDKKVDTIFRKYKNGMISYEVLGPLETRPHGEKMDKFGRLRPEIIKWVNPRTGEQLVVRRDGTLTAQGRNLRALMQKMRVNNTNYWDTWVDREFGALDNGQLRNPWDLGSDE